MVKKSITLQLGSSENTKGVLSLLRWYWPLVHGSRVTQATAWSSGSKFSWRNQDDPSIVSKLEGMKFNEAYWRYPRGTWQGRSAHIQKRLLLSPRNELWSSPTRKEYQDYDYEASQAWASHLSINEFVRWNCLRRFPTLIQIELVMEGDSETRTLLRHFSDSIWPGIQEVAGAIDLFGYADFGSMGFPAIHRMGYLEIPQLGRRFDALHPILIGGTSVCNALVRRLENIEGVEHELMQGSPVSMIVFYDYGVLRKPLDVGAKRTLDLIVPQKERTREPDPFLGEYLVGEKPHGRIYIEKQRFTELYGHEFLDHQEGEIVYWETVDPVASRMLDSYPREAIVAFSEIQFVEDFRSEVRNAAQELEGDGRVNDLWGIHERAFAHHGENLFGPESAQVVEIIKRHFFLDA